MFENLVSLSNISYLLVFLEGLISFLSPCVIPLIPIYMSYLAGNAKQIDEEGTITYKNQQYFFILYSLLWDILCFLSIRNGFYSPWKLL